MARRLILDFAFFLASAWSGRRLRTLPVPLLLAWSATISPFNTITAQAEWYVGGYGGIANPGAFSNATVSDPTLGGGVTNARINDLELESSSVWGAKGGYFFESRPWLGFETDVYTLTLNLKAQTIVGGTTTGRVFADNIPSIRSPSMSEVFNLMGAWDTDYSLPAVPKMGNRTSISVPDLISSRAPGMSYRRNGRSLGNSSFNRATIRFSDVRGNYDSQIFVLGVMWHFDK